MLKINASMETPPENRFTRRYRIRYSGALAAANALANEEIGTAPEIGHGELRGRHLRLIREQQNIDAAFLATRACLSLRQLYQLESGQTSLFYTPALRDLAGKRVAALLGVDWHSLGQVTKPEASAKPLLVGIPQPLGELPSASPGSAAVAQAVSIGLMREASETLTVAVPGVARIRPVLTHEPVRRASRSGFWRKALAAWCLCALAGVAIGWAVGTHTDLVWPGSVTWR